MDPFDDKVNFHDEEEPNEYEAESALDKSFSSRHSNGGEDNDFNRVSLPNVSSTHKNAGNGAISEKDIHFELENNK